MPNSRYRIAITGTGSTHSSDPAEAKADADFKARMMLRELLDAGHTIEDATLEIFDDGREDKREVMTIEDLKPRHHELTGSIVVDKRFAHLSTEEIMAGIHSGEIPFTAN